MMGNGGQNPQTDTFITGKNEPYVMKNMRVKKKTSIAEKILIIFGILIGIMVLMLGVFIAVNAKNRAKYKDPVFIQQDVTKYLEERYGEKFVVTFNRGT